MRAMWKGSVSFGLVAIPVRMYAATEAHDVTFRQVRRSDASRIRYRRVAEADGEVVEYADIAKGYELPDGQMVVLTDDDLDDLPLPTKRVVDVVEFVPLEQIDPILFNKSYYLEPEAQGLKPYALLRDVLRDSERVAVVKVALSNREQMATLRVRDDVLVLATMLWPDEIRVPEFGFLDEDVDLKPQELTMAESLVESMTADFDPDEFTDDYAEALRALVEAKIEGEDVVVPAGTGSDDEDAEVIDLMSSLRASIDEKKKARSGSGGGSGSSGSGSGSGSGSSGSGSATAKESTAKQTGAKASGAKKATAKKSPAKKTTGTTSTAKKSTATKSTATKSTAKKTTATKSTAKKTTAKKSTSKAESKRSA